jgi:hypothetical protein
MQERDRVFFEPLWRRIVLVIAVATWSAWEWAHGESFWGTMTAGVTAYCIWTYLIAFPSAGKQLKE